MDDTEYIYVNCPTCNLLIQINKKELNCRIFRHGIHTKTLQQLNPHASKEECDFCVKNNLIIGCGKPFIVVEENEEYVAKLCDYI